MAAQSQEDAMKAYMSVMDHSDFSLLGGERSGGDIHQQGHYLVIDALPIHSALSYPSTWEALQVQ